MEPFIIKHNPVERSGGMLVEYPAYASYNTPSVGKPIERENSNVHS